MRVKNNFHMKKILLGIILAIGLLPGCKKNESSPVEPSVYGSISGHITEFQSEVGLSFVSVYTEPSTSLVTTDAKGNFTIENVKPAAYKIFARKDGYDSLSTTVEVKAGIVSTSNFILNVFDSSKTRHYGFIQGIIRDNQTMLPVPKANIRTVPATSSITTDQDGHFLISNISPGDYKVYCSRAGYDSTSINIHVSQNLYSQADFYINAKNQANSYGQIQGTAVESYSGVVLSGVSISTLPASYAVTTDVSGSYQIQGLAAGQYTVKATKSGYEAVSVVVSVQAAKTTQASLTLALSNGKVLGMVTETDGRTPIQGVNVSTKPGTSSTNTDISGRYSLENVKAGIYSVSFQKTGYTIQTVSIVVSSGFPTNCDVSLVKQ